MAAAWPQHCCTSLGAAHAHAAAQHAHMQLACKNGGHGTAAARSYSSTCSTACALAAQHAHLQHSMRICSWPARTAAVARPLLVLAAAFAAQHLQHSSRTCNMRICSMQPHMQHAHLQHMSQHAAAHAACSRTQHAQQHTHCMHVNIRVRKYSCVPAS